MSSLLDTDLTMHKIGVVEPEAAEDAEEGAEQASGEEKGDNVE